MLPPPAVPQANLVPVVYKIKTAYLFWHSYFHKIPKIHRYTLALRIDTVFIELIEMASSSAFMKKSKKIPYLQAALRKLETLKVLLLVLWESRSIETKNYLELSEKLHEIGKMLGGWLGQVEKQDEKQNSLTQK